MIRIWVFSFMAFICCLTAKAQTSGKTNYEEQWRKIDSLSNVQRLPKSALAEIQKVYRTALAEKEYGQVVKAIIYRMNCQGQVEENTAKVLLDSLKQDATRLPQPARSVIYSIIGDVYKSYYQRNTWHVRGRTRTAVVDEDITTWDISRLFEEALKYYKLSIRDEKVLQQTPIDAYKEALQYDDEHRPLSLLPTLYDFLVFRTIQAYSGEMNVVLPQQTFVLNKPVYFADARTFADYPIETKDTLSAEYQVIRLYQKLIGFRLQQLDRTSSKETTDRYALVHIDIKRLKYVHLNGRYANNDRMFEEALKSMLGNYNGQAGWEYTAYALANLYKEQGSAWRDKKDNRLRPKYREAYDLCAQIISRYPKSEIAASAQKLQNEIKSPWARLTIANQQYPDMPVLALAEYRNVNKLYFYIYKITEKEAYSFRNIQRDSFKFAKREPFKIQEVVVPSQPDYQKYSAEIKIEALPQGFYILFISNMSDLTKQGDNNTGRNPISNVVFQVTPLTLAIRSGDNKLFGKTQASNSNMVQVYLTDSKTGEPLSNAKIDYYTERYRAGNQNEKGQYIETFEGSYYTDNTGIAYIVQKRNGSDFKKVLVTYKKERLVLHEWNIDYWWDRERKMNNRVVFFTDRSIYRPGQTVYYKALYLKSNFDGDNQLVANNKIKITLIDVNGKAISSQEPTTNEYGTVQGSFTIPQGLLNGWMRLSSTYGDINIQVEEYKRPTFEVQFDPVDKNYNLNEAVRVSGIAKALAGYSVDHAKVRYRVVRNVQYRVFRWWFPPIMDPQREIASGEGTTDSKGAFTIDFKTEADDIKNDDLIYDYTVTTDITDINGETRSSTLSVKIGRKPLLVTTSIPFLIVDRNSLNFNLNTTNLNGNFTPADVSVKVTALRSPGRIFRSRLWNAPDTSVLSHTEFETFFPYDPYGNEDRPEFYVPAEQITTLNINTKKDKKINLSSLKLAQPGWYKLEITARNENGVEVKQEKLIQLVGKPVIKKETSGTEPVQIEPVPIKRMDDWLTVIEESGEPGKNVEFWITGGEKRSYIRYEILLKNRIIEQKAIVAGTTPERIVIPIKEEYRGGFAVQFIMIQNQRKYIRMIPVHVPYTNKQLDIIFTTFRDKLLPGEQEKWTLTVKNKQGEKEVAEMAATLYDASLDAFRPHSWDGYKQFYPQRYYYDLLWRQPEHSPTRTTIYFNYDEYRAGIFVPEYPYLNMFNESYRRILNGYSITRATGNVAKIVIRGMSPIVTDAEAKKEKGIDIVDLEDNKLAVVDGSIMEESAIRRYSSHISISIADTTAEIQQPPLADIATRQNFNETAFFYPQLRTDEEGRIIIEFTIPEALTRWKMLGFAHTKDFKVGDVTNELITQKQVAISANAPRFFRENDVIEFTAKVNNITENELTGQAMLRLFDAATMQPVDAKIVRTSQILNFNVKAGESAGLKWTLAIPAGIQAITYKVTAQAGTHTDGEEKIIPVLSNTMLVTETMPFSIRSGQQKEFTFKRLQENQSPTLRNYRLTLEFTSNPAWYAIQAMSYLMEYPYECAEQVFSRFYANSLATTVMNSSPRVKQIFDLWRTQPENKNALLSNLEKNQELKQVMLEETPWVMQATNETERKKRIGLLFDLNRMGGEQRNAFNKLQKAQLSDGGFAWFSGLPANRFITQHIVAGIAHLIMLNALSNEFKHQTDDMINKGLGYLDYNIRKDYDALLKIKNIDLTKQHIDQLQLHYLYVCSFSGHKPENKAQLQAFDYYLSQAAKYWTGFNIYGQAMTALTMSRLGDKKTADAIVRSLKERAQQSEEMGMYWKDNVAGYFWYQAPIETQAILIEAFNEVANDRQAVEEMKIWLLRNKQTNDWRTTKATAEACYVLLMTGSQLLNESLLPDIKIGGKPLAEAAKEEIRPEPGTGYVKTAWQGSDIRKEMAVLEVSNPNKSGIAWGGVYWQYFEQLDKITSAETNLKMNKQLFLKKLTDRGAELLPLNEKNVLRIGDVVTVRIELHADRDYEYIHLKDMRAAGFEPTKAISGYRYQDGLWYYENIKDASTDFFITYLRKGTYVFEYELQATHSGQFSNGITTFQCMYAPEFSTHSEGIKVKVE